MLDINLGVMLLVAGIFLVTMFFLKMWLFDPLVKFMDEREAKLKKELELISKNTEETKKIEEEIQKIINLAKERAREIIEMAKKDAKEEAEKIKLQKEKEIEEAKKLLEEELKNEKERLLKELLSHKNEFKTLIEQKIKVAA